MKAILASVLLAWVAVSAAAQTPRVYGAWSTAWKPGKVRKLNKDLLTFSPLPGGPDITVKVAPETRLTRHNKPAQLKQIKAGNIVRVTFPIREGTVTAGSVPCSTKKTFPRASEAAIRNRQHKNLTADES